MTFLCLTFCPQLHKSIRAPINTTYNIPVSKQPLKNCPVIALTQRLAIINRDGFKPTFTIGPLIVVIVVAVVVAYSSSRLIINLILIMMSLMF